MNFMGKLTLLMVIWTTVW